MISPLVLSLFPGIGMLDKGFEEEGFCVVRGPDLLWGGDIREFHPPAGVFDGVIGGPPCQIHSVMASMNPHAGAGHGDLIPEFERIVVRARPDWFVMENVLGAREPKVDGYCTVTLVLDNNALGESQGRVRRFSFGTPDGAMLIVPLEAQRPQRELTVLAGHGPARGQRERGIAGRDWREMARLQGLDPSELEDAPFTVQGLKRVIGNGVPLPMSRAIARAVVKALERRTA